MDYLSVIEKYNDHVSWDFNCEQCQAQNKKCSFIYHVNHFIMFLKHSLILYSLITINFVSGKRNILIYLIEIGFTRHAA